MSMGKRIKALRIEKKMSQMQLAKKAGISQPVISDYENDLVKDYRAHILMKLAAALETTPEYLVTGKGEKNIFTVSATNRELVSIIEQLTPDAKAALLLAAKAMLKS